MSTIRHRFILALAALAGALAVTGCARTAEAPGQQSLDAACSESDRQVPRAPAEIRSLTNPLDATPENIAAGSALYQQDARPVACAQCHGVAGDGRGPLARHLDPEPSNFTCDFYNGVPDGQLFWVTQEGSNFMQVEEGHADVRRPGRRDRVSAMRPHRYYLSDTETWQIVAYLPTPHAENGD